MMLSEETVRAMLLAYLDDPDAPQSRWALREASVDLAKTVVGLYANLGVAEAETAGLRALLRPLPVSAVLERAARVTERREAQVAMRERAEALCESFRVERVNSIERLKADGAADDDERLVWIGCKASEAERCRDAIGKLAVENGACGRGEDGAMSDDMTVGEARRLWKGPACECCGKPATCHGAYEGNPPLYACDGCCGHGGEDGHCDPLVSPDPMTAAEAEQLRGALTDRSREELCRREPDWGDLCADVGAVELFVAAPRLLDAFVAQAAEVRRLTAALAGLRQSDAEQRDITREALATAQHAIDALRALPNTTP